jgi:hypothetical protein
MFLVSSENTKKYTVHGKNPAASQFRLFLKNLLMRFKQNSPADAEKLIE